MISAHNQSPEEDFEGPGGSSAVINMWPLSISVPCLFFLSIGFSQAAVPTWR
jgi:hypothetical protein